MCSTFCGIPWIELCGTELDWVSLRERAERIFGRFMPDYARILLPILDKFVDSYRGNVDYYFWQNMVKNIQHGRGSGEYSTISGWVQNLYPYLGKEPNPYLKPWDQMGFQDGPGIDRFPEGEVSSCSVEWDYFGTLYPLQFHAGIFGTKQDKETLAISTFSGWIVLHDSAADPVVRIKDLRNEIEALQRGGSTDKQTIHVIRKYQREIDRLSNL